MAWASERASSAPSRSLPRHGAPGALLARGGLTDYVELPPLMVLRRLGSTPRGLEEREAHARLAHCGENSVSWARPPHWGVQLLGTVLIRSSYC